MARGNADFLGSSALKSSGSVIKGSPIWFAFYTPSELAGSASLYEQLQKFDWYYMPEKWEFRQALSWIQAEHGVRRLLEVGGRGFFCNTRVVLVLSLLVLS